jgi:ADP-ribose pyrophosphatase
VNERTLYAGRVVTLKLMDIVGTDGAPHVREIVEHAAGAAIVAVDEDGQVLLVRQHRPAVGAHVLELPAGLVDPGEQPIDCAGRELEEETGYAAGSIEPLASFYSSPGFCTEVLHVFAAHQLRPAHAHPDEDEPIEVVRLPLEAAIEQALHADVTDAKTITGLLAYSRRAHTARA